MTNNVPKTILKFKHLAKLRDMSHQLSHFFFSLFLEKVRKENQIWRLIKNTIHFKYHIFDTFLSLTILVLATTTKQTNIYTYYHQKEKKEQKSLKNKNKIIIVKFLIDILI